MKKEKNNTHCAVEDSACVECNFYGGMCHGQFRCRVGYCVNRYGLKEPIHRKWRLNGSKNKPRNP